MTTLVKLPEPLKKLKNSTFNSLGQFFSTPSINALCQANWLTASISTYFGDKYTQEQYETLTTFTHLLHEKLRGIDETYIDKEFFETETGKRIIGKIFKGVVRDNRIEKINAMANLTVNLYVKSKVNVDEKEVYVDILDNLNSLQLSILEKAIIDMESRKENHHRGFGWEIIYKEYEKKGVSSGLLLQSIRTLENTALVNKNSATIQEVDKTHFITEFGEQFYRFVSDGNPKDNPYL